MNASEFDIPCLEWSLQLSYRYMMKYYWCAVINGDQPGAYLGDKNAVTVQK